MKSLRDLLLKERFGEKGIRDLLINSFQFTEDQVNDVMREYSPFYSALAKTIIIKENNGEYKWENYY